MNDRQRTDAESGASIDEARAQRREALLRPTAWIVLVWMLVYLLVPNLDELRVLFGGSPIERKNGDIGAIFLDPVRIIDFIFDKPLVELVTIVLIVTLIGWWRVLFIEPKSVTARRWYTMVLPLAMAAALLIAQVITIASTPGSGARLLVLQVVVMVFAVLVEEVSWRGVGVVGLRGSGFPEWSVWLLTSSGFAAMHLLNLLAGADLDGTLFQVGYAFLLGTACYLARRVGGLWFAIGIHLLNNTIQVTAQAAVDSPMFGVLNTLVVVSQALMLLSVPATIVLLVLEARRGRKNAPAIGALDAT